MATYDAQLNTYLTSTQIPSPEPTLLFQPIQLSVPNETTAPAISGVSPAEGSTLGQFDPVVFDITDASGIGLAVVLVEYASGECECAYDGSAFTASFENGSSVSVITGDGRRFSIKRFGGWKMAPTVRVKAVDTKGNVLT